MNSGQANTNDWGIGEYTPICLALAPSAMYEKIQYLRWTDELLNVTKDANKDSEKYRHNLYESWVVFFWSYLESFTEEACDEIEKSVHIKVRRSHLRSRSKFDGVFKYLELVCNEDFPSLELDSQLSSYRTIRNLCAHGAGGELRNQKVNELLGKFTHIEFGGGFQNLNKNQQTAFRSLGVKSDNGTYRITREFCEALFKFGVDYLLQLIRVSNSAIERSARFEGKS